MKTFLDDIESHLLITKNGSRFIKHKKIKHYKFINDKNHNKKDLPWNLLLGSSFLIKNNTIIELYSYCNYKQSLYTQITKYIDEWVCSINVINIQEGDPDSVLHIVNGINIINKPSVLEYFIVSFLNDGFYLYI